MKTLAELDAMSMREEKRDWNNFFAGEELNDQYEIGMLSAAKANQILRDYIEKHGVRVYASENQIGNFTAWAKENQGDTHQGLLINIQEIKKGPCIHEPKYLASDGTSECRHCGAKIKATWSVE